MVTISNIGFSEKEQKWYGWSHRAFFGFGIGSKVKKGDIAYNSPNIEDWIDGQKNFWKGLDVCEPDYEKKVLIKTSIKGGFVTKTPFPKKLGKGEWVAKTLEDARQMAIDFAKNIS